MNVTGVAAQRLNQNRIHNTHHRSIFSALKHLFEILVAGFIHPDFQIAVVFDVAQNILQRDCGILRAVFQCTEQILLVDNHRKNLVIDLRLEAFNPHQVERIGDRNRQHFSDFAKRQHFELNPCCAGQQFNQRGVELEVVEGEGGHFQILRLGQQHIGGGHCSLSHQNIFNRCAAFCCFLAGGGQGFFRHRMAVQQNFHQSSICVFSHKLVRVRILSTNDANVLQSMAFPMFGSKPLFVSNPWKNEGALFSMVAKAERFFPEFGTEPDRFFQALENSRSVFSNVWKNGSAFPV